VGTVDLSGGPEFAAADGKGSVFDNLEDESLVLKIDAPRLTVEQRWKQRLANRRAAWPWMRANPVCSLGAAAK
jgi:hypothetical protein